MLESIYQRRLIKKIAARLPGAFILKNDSGYIQGIPDLVVLYETHWAVLEVKVSADAPYEPNQEFYLNQLNDMSWAATIYPENEEEVLRELESALRPGRKARLPLRE